MQGGSQATLPSLSNPDTGGNTFDISGAGTKLDIAGACTISEGSLDVNSGAALSVSGPFTLQGNAGFSSITSAWKERYDGDSVGSVSRRRGRGFLYSCHSQ